MPYPKCEFTPAAEEDMRYRVEETDESLQSIADSHLISRGTLSERIVRFGWTPRKHRTKRDVPPGRDLDAIADAELSAQAAAKVAKRLRAGASTNGQPAGAEPADPASSAETVAVVSNADPPATAPRAEPARAASSAERVERLLVEQLSAFEAERLKLGPRSITKAARMTRMLERLTEALFKVERLRSAAALIPAGPHDYDDWPADIDAFRDELARRIRAFVARRRGARIPERATDSDTAPAS